jgi:plasmid maintenance system antidote protein VapI
LGKPTSSHWSWLKLSRYFGNSPEFWLSAQRELDLWEAERLHKAELKQIKPATAA